MAWEHLEDEESDSFWIRLDALVSSVYAKKNAGTNGTSGYTIGVHAFITRIPTVAGERNLDNWAKKYFFYPKHMPDATKVGWDKEHQKEVTVSSSKKSSKSFFKKAIVNKLKK